MGVASPVRIAVTGEIDLSTGPDFEARILTRIHRGGPDLIIDLSEVRFIGAAGLAVLLTAHETAAAAGVHLSVVACCRAVLRPLVITGLAAVLDLRPVYVPEPRDAEAPARIPSIA